LVENEGEKGVQEITERILIRKETSWKAQREVDRYRGQGC
jgi:hypothetical protein